MSGIFKFKQFEVDQAGCAMKINTDGVLLGVLAGSDQPKNILDIGTGTGVIALMLAQRFPDAKIDAVEIDEQAAETAKRNFANSPFTERLNISPIGFEPFFEQFPDKKYDLIVSNPPFYINSLKSPEKDRQLAKHADYEFFEKFISEASRHLSADGVICLILPIVTAELVMALISGSGLFLKKIINIRSFTDSEPHRMVIYLCSQPSNQPEISEIIIYKAVGIYSEEYIKSLKPYFIAF